MSGGFKDVLFVVLAVVLLAAALAGLTRHHAAISVLGLDYCNSFARSAHP